MPYTIKQLAELTGLTPRTLRYYDEIGLLCPARNQVNDYRLYGGQEVDRLRQILLYREMGLPLEMIGKLLDKPDLDRAAALQEHLHQLLDQRGRVDTLIRAVRRTLAAIEGGNVMSDMEKFEAMKQQAIRENEEIYGREVRDRYGNQTAEKCGQKMADMTEGEWDQMKEAEAGYQAALVRAVRAGDPDSADAREACRLHRAWLLHCWTPEMMTDRAHIELVEIYERDERFRAYYEKLAPGCAEFFARAVRAYYRHK